MCVVEPVDIVDKFVGFRSKADRLDMQICEPFILWVDHEVLGFDCHELWVEPHPEELSVERLPPFIVIILISVL